MLLFVASLIAMTISGNLSAQETEVGPYKFKLINEVEHTDVRDQHRTGTCWAFAAMGLVEAEVIRLGEKPVDLSEMWIVRNVYFEKVIKYVRMHGKINFSEGGNGHDTFIIIEKYGLVPEVDYPGNMYGTSDEGHVHGELTAVLKGFAETIIKNPNRGLSTAWKTALNNILDAYFGVAPKEFTYEGTEYTPMTFAKAMNIVAEDYVHITSFTHHPYYTEFAIEIPDNWAWGTAYNVPLSEFSEIPVTALKNGFSLCWDTDVSDKGFKHSKGLALYPNTDVKQMANSERARWGQESDAEVVKSIYDFEQVVDERKSCAHSRQKMFDNYNTTDDHLMLFTGLYEDQNGNKFFRTKNSWNTDSAQKGYLWTSVPFYNAKTISVSMHKDGLTPEMKKKLNIK